MDIANVNIVDFDVNLINCAALVDPQLGDEENGSTQFVSTDEREGMPNGLKSAPWIDESL